jgi:hypothetical protein
MVLEDWPWENRRSRGTICIEATEDLRRLIGNSRKVEAHASIVCMAIHSSPEESGRLGYSDLCKAGAAKNELSSSYGRCVNHHRVREKTGERDNRFRVLAMSDTAET